MHKDSGPRIGGGRTFRTLLGLLLLLPLCAFGKGFDDRFVASVGHFNFRGLSDGLQDIYIRQKPRIVPIALDDITVPIPLKPDVDAFVLRQRTDGTFEIVTSLTGAEKASLASWSSVPSITLLTSDLNLDGSTDLIVKGIAGSVSTYNQLVFANATNGRTADRARNIDPQFSGFMKDAYRWVEDSDYFHIASLLNGWYTNYLGDPTFDYWYADYLYLWNIPAHGGSTALIGSIDEVFDPAHQPASCGQYTCQFDYELGVWQVRVTIRPVITVYDNFNLHFDTDAVQFARTAHGSLQELKNIVAAKLQVPSIGGGEKSLVARTGTADSEPVADEFWDDLILSAVLHDNYCATQPDCGAPLQEVSRVDIVVDRAGQNHYYSPSCGMQINYTYGTYEVSAYNPNNGSQPDYSTLNGFTLERGGPDSKTPAGAACSNDPKRIPQGTYTFTVHGGPGRKWQNVPGLDTSKVNRSSVLIHAAEGAYGSIGCIVIATTSGESGTFTGGMASSVLALAQLQKLLFYRTQNFRYSYGYVTVNNHGN